VGSSFVITSSVHSDSGPATKSSTNVDNEILSIDRKWAHFDFDRMSRALSADRARDVVPDRIEVAAIEPGKERDERGEPQRAWNLHSLRVVPNQSWDVTWIGSRDGAATAGFSSSIRERDWKFWITFWPHRFEDLFAGHAASALFSAFFLSTDKLLIGHENHLRLFDEIADLRVSDLPTQAYEWDIRTRRRALLINDFKHGSYGPTGGFRFASEKLVWHCGVLEDERTEQVRFAGYVFDASSEYRGTVMMVFETTNKDELEAIIDICKDVTSRAYFEDEASK
jgi:hypothetical protein